MTFLARGPGSNLFLSSSQSRARSAAPAEFSASQFLQELTLSLGGDTTLQRKLGEDTYASLRSLAREPNPQYFFEAFLNFTRRLENLEESTELCSVFYSQILQNLQAFPQLRLPNIAQLAQERLDAIQGRGAALPRAEFLLRRLAQQASDPAMIAAMAVAGGVFGMTRLSMLSRLATSPASRLWTQGAGARLIANTVGFLAEAPAFTATARGMNALLGRPQNWSAEALGREFSSGAITLLGLKLAGSGANTLVQRLNRGLAPAQLSASRTLLSTTIPQAATLGGILVSHRVEERLGLREHVDGATTFTDALGTLLNLQVGGRLMHQALGPRYQALSQSLTLRSEWIRLSSWESNPAPHQNHTSLRHAGAIAALLSASLAIAPAESQAAIRTSSSQPSENGRNIPTSLTALATIGFAMTRRRNRGNIASGNDPSQPRPRATADTSAPEATTAPSSELEASVSPYNLRDYQETMISALRQNVRDRVSSWLGLASPMQTGKSFLAGPIIRMLREELGQKTRFLILSSGRVITDQLMRDLSGGFPGENLGRFDGATKDTQQITVASVYSLVRHLDSFNNQEPTVLINDEAYYTQAPIFRRIYQHFGLGEEVERAGKTTMAPRIGNGLVIGLSGTGNGLEGYQISGQLNILDAIEAGWIRNMHGERVIMNSSFEEKNDPSGESMVWWQANSESADALAELYDQRLHGNYRKILIFVPTIEHGDLLRSALCRKYGDEQFHTAHSSMKDEDFDQVIASWQGNGGTLISVRRLTRGFRGTGTDAVFHTYQTDSAELFGQRTGRAWGQDGRSELSPLYVLETAWSQRPSMATLARLLGLVEYPQHGFSTKGLRAILENIRDRRQNEKNIQSQIELGTIFPSFARIPLLESWRTTFSSTVVQQGNVNAMSLMTNLPSERLIAWVLGAVPTQLNEMRILSPFLGGEPKAIEIWIRSWENIHDEFVAGARRMDPALANDLLLWRNSPGSSAERASSLNEILLRHFPVQDPILRPRLNGIRLLVSDLRTAMRRWERSLDLDDEGLAQLIRRQASNLLQRLEDPADRTLLADSLLSSAPRDTNDVRSELNLSLNVTYSRLESLRGQLLRQVMREEVFTNDHLNLPIELTEFRIPDSMVDLGYNTLGDIISSPRRVVQDLLSPSAFSELESVLSNSRLTFNSQTFLDRQLRDPSEELPKVTLESLRGDISSLGLNERANNALSRMGIRNIWQLVQFTQEEIKEIPGIGEYSSARIARALIAKGIYYGTKMDPIPSDSAETSEPNSTTESTFHQRISEMDISARTRTNLVSSGIVYVGDLVQLNGGDLVRRGFPTYAIAEIRTFLAQSGLRLQMTINWQRPQISPDSLNMRISDTDLSRTIIRTLEGRGIVSLGQLAQLTENDLLYGDINRAKLREIKSMLATFDLHLGMTIE